MTASGAPLEPAAVAVSGQGSVEASVAGVALGGVRLAMHPGDPCERPGCCVQGCVGLGLGGLTFTANTQSPGTPPVLYVAFEHLDEKAGVQMSECGLCVQLKVSRLVAETVRNHALS